MRRSLLAAFLAVIGNEPSTDDVVAVEVGEGDEEDEGDEGNKGDSLI